MNARLAAAVFASLALAAACTNSDGTGPGAGGMTIPSQAPGPKWSGVATAVTVGMRSNCLLQPDGTPWCWGNMFGFGLRMDVGLRGVPHNEEEAYVMDSMCTTNAAPGMYPGWPCNIFHPVRLSTKQFVSLRLNQEDAPLCGLDASGTAWCWDDAPMIDIPGADSVDARHVRWCGDVRCMVLPQHWRTGDQPLRDISPQNDYPCVLTQAGSVLCAGDNRDNLFGTAPLAFTTDTLVPVPGIPAGATALAHSPLGLFACVLTTAGKIYCWGNNDHGAVGINSTAAHVPTPSQVAAPASLVFTRVVATAGTACGLTTAGQAYCWGASGDGEAGWSSGWPLAPVAIPGGHTFTQIAAGGFHLCGLDAGGSAWCWGDNNFGELGVPHGAMCGSDFCATTPVAVAGGLSFKQIAAGLNETCGVTTAGEVYCWGVAEYGLLGGPLDRSITWLSTPQKITP